MVTTQTKGLIANISSAGGLQYSFDIPYGCGKAALDRMSADMALELAPTNIACVSIWPGPVNTEKILALVNNPDCPALIKGVFADSETVEFTGKTILALAKDPNVMKWSGKVLQTNEIAEHYKFVDEDGKLHSVPISQAHREKMKQPPPHWVFPTFEAPK